MMRITDTVKHLIIINVIFFIGTQFVGEGRLFFDWFAMHFPDNNAFKPWQIITHMFMHGGITHLLFNMLALWMFGSAVEHYLGKKKFLFLYFSAGLGAVLLHTGVSYYTFYSDFSILTEAGFDPNKILDTLNSEYRMRNLGWDPLLGAEGLTNFLDNFNTPMVGASGCIMGVLVAFAIMNPNAELMLIFLPIPVKAKYFIPALVGYDIISGFLGGSSIFGLNIAHWAHVGGAIIGFITMWYWKKNSMNKYRWDR